VAILNVKQPAFEPEFRDLFTEVLINISKKRLGMKYMI